MYTCINATLCPVLSTFRLRLRWERVIRYSTDLDRNQSPDRLYLSITCEHTHTQYSISFVISRVLASLATLKVKIMVTN